MPAKTGLNIAVVGSGISGLSAGWLLSRAHNVTLLEADSRLGGHGHTVDVPTPHGNIAVDTGFIVFNDATYPNFIALLKALDVPAKLSEMSFAVSLDNGGLEYNGTSVSGLFAQKSNLLRPRFWSMMRDLLRFYKEAPRDLPTLGDQSLDDYLRSRGYGAPFIEDHLYPMAAAIWSTPAGEIGNYPAAAMLRFCENHGLLKVSNRPKWRTVDGGSRNYIERMAAEISGAVRLNSAVHRVERGDNGVALSFRDGTVEHFDQVVLACHADQALDLLSDPGELRRKQGCASQRCCPHAAAPRCMGKLELSCKTRRPFSQALRDLLDEQSAIAAGAHAAIRDVESGPGNRPGKNHP